MMALVIHLVNLIHADETNSFQVPQQRNGEDCGIFVLYFINLFLEGAPENFSIFEGYPYFVSSWFPDLLC